MGVAQIDRKRAELQIRFMENAAIDPQHLMRLVAKNAKRGAQFSPQGVLRWPLSSAKAEDVLAETRSLLEQLVLRPA